MPIYEYVCQKCGEKFEKLLRSGSGQIEVTCPKCGASEVKKAFSLFGVGGAKTGGTSASAGGCAPKGG